MNFAYYCTFHSLYKNICLWNQIVCTSLCLDFFFNFMLYNNKLYDYTIIFSCSFYIWVFQLLNSFRSGLLRLVLPWTLNTYLLVEKKMLVTYLGMELLGYRVCVCLDIVHCQTCPKWLTTYSPTAEYCSPFAPCHHQDLFVVYFNLAILVSEYYISLF